MGGTDSIHWELCNRMMVRILALCAFYGLESLLRMMMMTH